MGRHGNYQHQLRAEPLRELPGLPPLPNPDTGEPFPPHGCAFEQWRRANRQPEHWPYQRPIPPDGEGPVLAWRNESLTKSVIWYIGTAVALMLLSGLAILVTVGDPVYAPMKFWQLWLVVLVSAYVFKNPLKFEVQGSGAYWYKWGFRKQWYQRIPRQETIFFYDLVSIAIEKQPGQYMMRLEDMHGNVTVKPVFRFQDDRRIWDLMYNGFLYSIANGAEYGEDEVRVLEFDKSPYWDAVLRNRRGEGQPSD